MRKKNFWVVTQVVVGRVSFSIETYVLGCFDSFNEAKCCLEDKYIKLCKLGYETSKFARNDWELTYKSEFVILQVVINHATAG